MHIEIPPKEAMYPHGLTTWDNARRVQLVAARCDRDHSTTIGRFALILAVSWSMLKCQLLCSSMISPSRIPPKHGRRVLLPSLRSTLRLSFILQIPVLLAAGGTLGRANNAVLYIPPHPPSH